MGNHYTCQQFIDAIPGTGGIVAQIAKKVGCAWNTARKYIDTYPTVNRAWRDERHSISDIAQHNIVEAIRGGDLQMSKWWLQVMDSEFMPRQAHELSGPEGSPLPTGPNFIIVRDVLGLCDPDQANEE